MGRRTLLLIASILVAALGTALVWLYVQGADSRATAGEAQVDVYVAAHDVGPGEPATSVEPVVQKMPQSFVSAFGDRLVTDRNQIAGFTATKIVQGLPLLNDQFQSTQVTPTPPVQLNPTKLAIQVSLPDPQRLAGLLQPGSMIRIFVAQQLAGSSSPRAKVLLPSVKVLASGPVAESNGASTAKGQIPLANVTLEVDNTEAISLVQTQAQGGGGNNLWFGLLGARTPPPDPTGSAG